MNKIDEIAKLVRTVRKAQGLTQTDLALTSGTGLRFIVDLEKGKPTCQMGKVLTVIQTLGIQIKFAAPDIMGVGSGTDDGSGRG